MFIRQSKPTGTQKLNSIERPHADVLNPSAPTLKAYNESLVLFSQCVYIYYNKILHKQMKQCSEKKNVCCCFRAEGSRIFLKRVATFFSPKLLRGLDKQQTKGRSHRALEFGLSCVLLHVYPYCLSCTQKFASRPTNRSHLNSAALTVKVWAAT